MREILDGVHHWTGKHPEIGIEVSSYWFRDTGVVLDPMVPAEGLDALAGDPPRHVVLTNRLHRRQQDEYVRRFGVDVFAPRAGMHQYGAGTHIKPYDPETELPGGFIVYEIGVICPDEMALHQPALGVLACADGVMRYREELHFVVDEHIGEDPPAIRRGLCEAYARLLDLDFDHLLVAHGEPVIGGAKDELRRFALAHAQ